MRRTLQVDRCLINRDEPRKRYCIYSEWNTVVRQYVVFKLVFISI